MIEKKTWTMKFTYLYKKMWLHVPFNFLLIDLLTTVELLFVIASHWSSFVSKSKSLLPLSLTLWYNPSGWPEHFRKKINQIKHSPLRSYCPRGNISKPKLLWSKQIFEVIYNLEKLNKCKSNLFRILIPV